MKTYSGIGRPKFRMPKVKTKTRGKGYNLKSSSAHMKRLRPRIKR